MDTILWTEESDNYTKRTIEVHNGDLYSTKIKQDIAKEAYEILSKFLPKSASPPIILDIGCSIGRFIHGLRDYFTESQFYGIDPGKESISIAKRNIEAKKNRNIRFDVGYSHKLPYKDDMFDIVLLNMVLQWIPRKYLVRTISEIDRVLKVGGIICICDFLTNKHITSQSRYNRNVYIFKEDYAKLFTAFAWYHRVFEEVKRIEDGEDQQRNIVVCRKYAIDDVYLMKHGATEEK